MVSTIVDGEPNCKNSLFSGNKMPSLSPQWTMLDWRWTLSLIVSTVLWWMSASHLKVHHQQPDVYGYENNSKSTGII